MIYLKSYSKPFSLLFVLLLLTGNRLFAQVELPTPVIDSNELALKYMKEQRKKWGLQMPAAGAPAAATHSPARRRR